MIRPVMPMASLKVLATLTACWPVAASATSSTSRGSTTFLIFTQFVEQFLIHFLPARGVEDGDSTALLLDPLQRLARDLHRVRLARRRLKDRHAEGVAQHDELLHRRGTEDVARDEQRALALLLQQCRQLGGGRRLARAVQARDQDALGRGDVERDGAAAQQRGKFVVEDLHDLLCGRDGAQHLLAQRLRLHRLAKVLGDLEIHIRLQQTHADLPHRVRRRWLR